MYVFPYVSIFSSRFICKEVSYLFPEQRKNPGIFYPYSAGIDLSRHTLTSVDVRFWRLKSIPAL